MTARATAIVPQRPQVVHVVQRLEMRRAVRVCIGAAASTLVAPLVPRTDSHAALMAIAASIACLSGIAAVVLRFVEEPREVAVRRSLHDRWIIH